MNRRRATRFISAAVPIAAAMATMSCSASDHSSPGASAPFWDSHTAVGASEMNRPASLVALSMRSDEVVMGAVTKIEPGKDYTQPGKAPNRTINLSIQDSAHPERVFLLELNESPTAESAEAPPPGQYVFFLKKWYVDDAGNQVYGCTSPALCVFGGSPPSTLLDPQAVSDLSGMPNSLPQILSAATQARGR